MGKRLIDKGQWLDMLRGGTVQLAGQEAHINALNVFPVPDGDTGSNMNMTMKSGLAHVLEDETLSLGDLAARFAEGLLIGARGNSGVILSQLLRGFEQVLRGKEQMTATDLADALGLGIDAAYQAVLKPVEGTILTVGREAAAASRDLASSESDVEWVLRETIKAAQLALDDTPNRLPLLKQAGVVDSGGQGFVTVLEGMLMGLAHAVPADATLRMTLSDTERTTTSAQQKVDISQIEHFYDMEFFIALHAGKIVEQAHHDLQERLEQLGDSLLLIPGGEVLKVHVHSKSPGRVLDAALEWGELRRIHVENMREQHETVVHASQETCQVVESGVKERAIVAVAPGDGFAELYRSMGVDAVISGGQTMNPSTEELLAGIRNAGAQEVIVLPNNRNIVLAARQAAAMSTANVHVLPTSYPQQAVAALLVFDRQVSVADNLEAMEQAVTQIRTAQFTHAVRHAEIDGLKIAEDDYLGLIEERVVAANADFMTAMGALLEHLLNDEQEVLTVYCGQRADATQTEQLFTYIQETYPDLEVEQLDGGQPSSAYLLSAE